MGEIARHYSLNQTPADGKLLSQDYLNYIRQVLSSLPPQTREVFRLCREQNQSYDEVAGILGISRNAVKKHIVRSNKVFKRSIQDELDISVMFLLLLFSAKNLFF